MNRTPVSLSRRDFMQVCFISGGGLLLSNCRGHMSSGLLIEPDRLIGRLRVETVNTPLKGAIRYFSEEVGDGLLYLFPEGALAENAYLTADMLLDGIHMAAFLITLEEGENGPAFTLNFKALNQCTARIRFSTALVDQNRWKLSREGAWLKPVCGGDRVDLKKVDRMTFTVFRNGGKSVRWCLTSFTATTATPPRLKKPALPKGPLIDRLGQSTLHEWSGKTESEEKVIQRLRTQKASIAEVRWPDVYSPWGGAIDKNFDAKGFFYTRFDGKRWWLVDPDGYAFWSAGCDCVRVDTAAYFDGLETALTWLPDRNGRFGEIYRDKYVNYLTANFIRAFGPENWYSEWSEIALAQLKRIGFNTVGNWSDWKVASEAGIPYVRPLSLNLTETRLVYRDFPDVYAPSYASEARNFAEQLRETNADPALIGYFLMNEPTWGFSTELPAAGMLFNTPVCETRKVLADYLRNRYPDDDSLSRAWNIQTTAAKIAEGEWTTRLTPQALTDLEKFSEMMTDRFFKILTEACRAVDPNHLNLGARYHKIPPAWALKGMKYFDVFSMNCYREKIPHDQLEQVDDLLGLPVMIGEFHFGALDVGLPATGIGHVKDQRARGQAYRVYVEDAAANPQCVGAHWFTLYDQSALGRFDGENYNIGFLDVCNKPYEELVEAARNSHERLYNVATGSLKPYDDEPQYFPKLF